MVVCRVWIYAFWSVHGLTFPFKSCSFSCHSASADDGNFKRRFYVHGTQRQDWSSHWGWKSLSPAGDPCQPPLLHRAGLSGSHYPYDSDDLLARSSWRICCCFRSPASGRSFGPQRKAGWLHWHQRRLPGHSRGLVWTDEAAWQSNRHFNAICRHLLHDALGTFADRQPVPSRCIPVAPILRVLPLRYPDPDRGRSWDLDLRNRHNEALTQGSRIRHRKAESADGQRRRLSAVGLSIHEPFACASQSRCTGHFLSIPFSFPPLYTV